ncbi:MAG: maleate cis-trans isomerase [Betaproteobacteria bacterium]|nr:maleate cis-trans isomerase [Betaproteobacteria bacterium]
MLCSEYRQPGTPRAAEQRVGLMVPSSNTGIETEFVRSLPRDITIHSARLPLFVSVEPKAIELMSQDIENASRLLATAAVDLLFVGATVPSLLKGVGHDKQMIARIRELTGIRATTTSTAVIDSLTELGVRKLVLGTPFVEPMNVPIVAFLEASGFQVIAAKGLGYGDNVEIGRLPAESAYELARELHHPDSEAFLFACTNWRILPAVERIEAEFGRPVVTSNQASLRGVLCALGRPAHLPGCGRLLDCILRHR